MSAAGSTSDADGAQLTHLIARTQHRQIVIGPDVGNDRGIVGSRQAQPHHRPRKVRSVTVAGMTARSPAGEAGISMLTRTRSAGSSAWPDPGLDRGGARCGRQFGSQHLDLDQILPARPARAARLAAVPPGWPGR